jgi:hypothetical protein
MENPNPASQEAQDMLDRIASFLRQYLVCDEHQLTVLTLWTVHTWCFQHFANVPYLDIRSPQPQSGKTRCLHLLRELCESPVFSSGAPARTLMARSMAPRAVDSWISNVLFNNSLTLPCTPNINKKESSQIGEVKGVVTYTDLFKVMTAFLKGSGKSKPFLLRRSASLRVSLRQQGSCNIGRFGFSGSATLYPDGLNLVVAPARAFGLSLRRQFRAAR